MKAAIYLIVFILFFLSGTQHGTAIHEHTQWYMNHWVLSLYGFIAYTVLALAFSKDAMDEAGKRFQFKKYMQQHWDNWLVTIVFVPIIVIFGKDIVDWYNDWKKTTFQFYEFYYILTGAIVEVAYLGMAKVRGLVKKLKT